MKAFRMVTAVLLYGFLALATSCSEGTNINQIFVTSASKDALDVLYSEAQLAYDQGNYDEAEEKAKKAFNINQNNEDVAILLGYIYLSRAGIDPFQLAEALIDGSGTENTNGNSNSNLVAASTNAAGQLGSLSSVLGISNADVQKLGDVPSADETPSQFQEFPVVRPDDASVAREESGVAALFYANEAVKIICPFVDHDAVLIDTDPRHTSDACAATANEVYSQNKSHFLWAFAHLADALAFQSVLLYTNSDSDTPNIERRAAVVNSADVTDFTTYLELVDALATDIDRVFSTADDSALNAVLNGLTAASKAFATMAGVPDSVTAGIDAALETINTATSSVPSSSGGSAGASVLKGQLTENVSTQLGQKIEDLKTSDPAEYESNIETICSTFDTIAAGQSNSRPSDCD